MFQQQRNLGQRYIKVYLHDLNFLPKTIINTTRTDLIYTDNFSSAKVITAVLLYGGSYLTLISIKQLDFKYVLKRVSCVPPQLFCLVEQLVITALVSIQPILA